MKTITNTSKTT